MRSTAQFVATALISTAAVLAAGVPASATGTTPARGELGPSMIGGLPAHPLLVHIPVVLIPLAAIALLASAVWPAARRKLTWISPLLAVVALVSVPLATSSGEQLEEKVQFTPLIERHEEAAEGLLLWVVGLAVWALLVWGLEVVRQRREDAEQPSPIIRRAIAAVAILGAVAFSTGSVMQVYRVGESGAGAVWTDTATGK